MGLHVGSRAWEAGGRWASRNPQTPDLKKVGMS